MPLGPCFWSSAVEGLQKGCLCVTGHRLAGPSPSLGSALPGLGHSRPPVIQAKGFPQSPEHLLHQRLYRSALRKTKQPTVPETKTEKGATATKPYIKTCGPVTEQVHRLEETGLVLSRHRAQTLSSVVQFGLESFKTQAPGRTQGAGPSKAVTSTGEKLLLQKLLISLESIMR